MNYQNVKVYLFISVVLIILFIVLIFYSTNKKSSQLDDQQILIPTPTSIEINKENNFQNNQPIIITPAEFTGVLEEEPPENIKNKALEKQNLRNLTPFDSGLYKIDFDYSEDKFIVYLNEPKEENKKEFFKWLKENFPNLPENQFNFR